MTKAKSCKVVKTICGMVGGISALGLMGIAGGCDNELIGVGHACVIAVCYLVLMGLSINIYNKIDEKEGK